MVDGAVSAPSLSVGAITFARGAGPRYWPGKIWQTGDKMTKAQQTERVAKGNGFIAALDQSGGSTPKALRLYGVAETAYSGEAEMYDMIHAMRSRIIKSPAFTGDKVVGAILFEQTMDRTVDGIPTATYLWDKRQVVPFLKIDKGLEAEVNGCQVMKPMPDLDALLDKAVKAGIYGTKERSVVSAANAEGIQAVVDQQFAVGRQVLAKGLMPIIEPEVTISIADKVEAEALLRAALLKALDGLQGQKVMLKLDPAIGAELLCALGRPSECAKGRGAVGRLFARRRQRYFGAEPRDHRLVQPRADRRANRPADGR